MMKPLLFISTIVIVVVLFGSFWLLGSGSELSPVKPVAIDTSVRSRKSKPAKQKKLLLTEVDLLEAINKARQEIDLLPLRKNSILVQVASTRAFDMKDREYFGGVSPLGESVETVAGQAGYQHLHLKELRLKGKFESVSEILDEWLEQDENAQHFLLPGFEETGLAIERIDDHMLLVQVLAVPHGACEAPSFVLAEELEKNKQLLINFGISVDDYDFETEDQSYLTTEISELLAVTKIMDERLNNAETEYRECLKGYAEKMQIP